MKKLLLFMVALVCVFSYVAVAQEQEPGAQKKEGQTASAKQARWEGTIQLVNKDNSTLTVKNVRSGIPKTIHFDNATKWVSQEHGSKKVNNIDATQVKEGDRVICIGNEDKEGFHATMISKRLTPLR